MKIEVSNGEIIDKITILKIKSKNIKDKDKLVNINKELSILSPLLEEIGINEDHELFIDLLNINKELWKIEDNIRAKEKGRRFDFDFIELARAVYVTNDKRSDIKKEINIVTGSELTEEKSYEEYQ
tara:strand:+ start:1290 stop:1667 length:378 start_codon:yes stop_codon:yes gene_type:complete